MSTQQNDPQHSRMRTVTQEDLRKETVVDLADELEAHLRYANWLDLEVVGRDGAVITAMVDDMFHEPRMVTITVAAT